MGVEEEVVETPLETVVEEVVEETHSVVVVDKNGSGDVSFNFGSDGKINFS